MDYHAINIAPPGVNKVNSDIKPGLYDQWAIGFAYTKSIRRRNTENIKQVSEKDHFFGNDADDMRSPGRSG